MTEHHDHDHGAHGHGHAHDQGWRGAARYLRILPKMWNSPVSDAVVDLVAPRPGELVVDLGAGMGPAAMRAARLGAQVVAVDPTPMMRRVLSSRRRVSSERGRISVHDGAAEALPLADACADGLWSVNTMHHWSDLGAGLAEIARVLRPGGRIVLVDEDFADPTHPSHAAHQKRAADHQHHFDHVEPDDVATRLGTHDVEIIEAARRSIAGRPAVVIHARRR